MRSLAKVFAFAVLGSFLAGCAGAGVDPDEPALGNVSQALEPGRRGLLAVEDGPPEPLRGVFFFAGQANDGTQAYELPVGNNRLLYTVTPVDDRLLKWADSFENRRVALEQIEKAGANVVIMSSWGARGTDYWAKYAPMQTSTYANDQLFEAAAKSRLVIMPAIESYPEFIIGHQIARYDTWPDHDPANDLVDFPANNTLLAQIEDLAKRYLHCGEEPVPLDCAGGSSPYALFAKHWARILDRDGAPRYAIYLPFVCANSVNPSSHGPARTRVQRLADSLDMLANVVFEHTRVRVGFTIDPIDHKNDFCSPDGVLTAEVAGPALLAAKSVLAIQPFREEAPGFPSGDPRHGQLFDPGSDYDRASRKHAFIKRWVATGLPVYLDTNSGYDGELVFGAAADPTYGRGDEWRNFQSQLKGSGVRGITFNAWNGYTEGWAGMETCRGSSSACTSPNRSTSSWMGHNFKSDPRVCDSWQYEGGEAKYFVTGEICKKWADSGLRWVIAPGLPPVLGSLGGSLGALGSARSSELSVPCVPDAKMTRFDEGVVMWSPNPAIGGHEVHGLIASKYGEMGEACSYLGMPLSDEEGSPGSCRVSRFQGGTINWCPGWTSALALPYS